MRRAHIRMHSRSRTNLANLANSGRPMVKVDPGTLEIKVGVEIEGLKMGVLRY